MAIVHNICQPPLFHNTKSQKHHSEPAKQAKNTKFQDKLQHITCPKTFLCIFERLLSKLIADIEKCDSLKNSANNLHGLDSTIQSKFWNLSQMTKKVMQLNWKETVILGELSRALSKFSKTIVPCIKLLSTCNQPIFEEGDMAWKAISDRKLKSTDQIWMDCSSSVKAACVSELVPCLDALCFVLNNSFKRTGTTNLNILLAKRIVGIFIFLCKESKVELTGRYITFLTVIYKFFQCDFHCVLPILNSTWFTGNDSSSLIKVVFTEMLCILKPIVRIPSNLCHTKNYEHDFFDDLSVFLYILEVLFIKGIETMQSVYHTLKCFTHDLPYPSRFINFLIHEELLLYHKTVNKDFKHVITKHVQFYILIAKLVCDSVIILPLWTTACSLLNLVNTCRNDLVCNALIDSFENLTKLDEEDCSDQDDLFKLFLNLSPIWKTHHDLLVKLVITKLKQKKLDYLIDFLNLVNIKRKTRGMEAKHLYPYFHCYIYATKSSENDKATLGKCNSKIPDKDIFLNLLSRFGIMKINGEQPLLDTNVLDLEVLGNTIQQLMVLKGRLQKQNIQNLNEIKKIGNQYLSHAIDIPEGIAHTYYLHEDVNIFGSEELANVVYKCIREMLSAILKLIFVALLIVIIAVCCTVLEGAKLKKYLSLKYNYDEAALYLLWISNDVQKNPGPVGDTFSESIRPVMKKLCSNLMKLYTGKQSKWSPNNLWNIKTDFNLYDPEHCKAYSCTYKSLSDEVLADVLIVCINSAEQNWEISELLRDQIQAWQECDFKKLIYLSFTSGKIGEAIGDIMLKLAQLTEYAERSKMTPKLEKVGIIFCEKMFQDWTKKNSAKLMVKEADLRTEAHRHIERILINTLDGDTKNKKQRNNTHETFNDLLKLCKDSSDEDIHKVLQDYQPYINARSNWINRTKGEKKDTDLIEQYVLHHHICVIKKHLDTLKTEGLLEETASILKGRGLKLSDEWSQKDDPPSILPTARKRKYKECVLASRDTGEQIPLKISPKEKKLSEKGELWILLRGKKLKVVTHGYTPDFTKPHKGWTEIPITYHSTESDHEEGTVQTGVEVSTTTTNCVSQSEPHPGHIGKKDTFMEDENEASVNGQLSCTNGGDINSIFTDQNSETITQDAASDLQNIADKSFTSIRFEKSEDMPSDTRIEGNILDNNEKDDGNLLTNLFNQHENADLIPTSDLPPLEDFDKIFESDTNISEPSSSILESLSSQRQPPNEQNDSSNQLINIMLSDPTCLSQRTKQKTSSQEETSEKEAADNHDNRTDSASVEDSTEACPGSVQVNINEFLEEILIDDSENFNLDDTTVDFFLLNYIDPAKSYGSTSNSDSSNQSDERADFPEEIDFLYATENNHV